MSAPAPDYDDDDLGETRLTPGDELARWRRMAAREAPAGPKEPVAPSSRPLLPGGGPGAKGSDEKTPERGIAAVTSAEVTPPRGSPMEVTPARPIAALEDHVADNANLRDGPLAPRLSPVPPRASPVPPRASAPPQGPRVLALPQNPRTSGPAFAVFNAPPKSGEAPIPLTEKRSVPPPPSGSTPLSARPLPAQPEPPRPALQPPPPSMSLPPVDRPPLPSIPPAPPLGFSEPPAHASTRSVQPAQPEGGRGRAIAAGLVIVVVAVALGGYWALRTPSGGPIAVPTPTAPTPPAPPVVAAVPDAGPPAVVAAPEPEPEIETPPTASIAELLATGDAALRAGEAEDALASYRAVTDLDAHDPYGHAGTARALLLLNRAAEAVSAASRAVAHRQRRASFRVLLGDAYEANGEHARAVAEWRTALELEPDGEARSRLHE